MVQVEHSLNDFILDLLVGEPFHVPRIEDDVTRLVNGSAQTLLNDAKIIGRWSLHFPKNAVSQEIGGLGAFTPDAFSELDVHAISGN